MRIFLLLLSIASFLFILGCKKDNAPNQEPVCNYGKDYKLIFSNNISSDGLLPLHRNNYWIYADTLWNGNTVTETSIDTIIIERIYELSGDVWWDFNDYFPHLHQTANEINVLESIWSTGCKAKRLDYFPTTTDTLREWVAYEGDMMIERISYTKTQTVVTPAGSFDNCSYFSTDYDQQSQLLKPGVGFIELTLQYFGSEPLIRKRTLIDYHLE